MDQGSRQDIAAAAAVHHELGRDYDDAIAEGLIERIGAEIDKRVDARLGSKSRDSRPAEVVPSGRRVTLLMGVAIGIFVTGVPSVLVAASGGGVLAKDETALLTIIAALWALTVAVGAIAWRPVRRRRAHTGPARRG